MMDKVASQAREQCRSSSSGRTLRVSKAEIKCPWIAWPTVLLGILAPVVWARSIIQIALGASGASKYYYSFLSFMACFFCFTPVHDAAHWAIGRRTLLARTVNEAVGRINAFPLLSPFPAFRHVHMLHHKYTNDPDKDPDFYSQGGVGYCLFQELYNYYFCFRHYSEVPGKVWAESLATLALTLYIVRYYGFQTLGMDTMLWGVLLPQRLAIIYLAYCFDYVPHYQAKGRPQTNPYLVTKRITGFWGRFDANRIGVGWLLRMVLANQDAHIIHHLYPTLPFYQYHAVWDGHEKEFYQAGIQKTTLF